MGGVSPNNDNNNNNNHNNNNGSAPASPVLEGRDSPDLPLTMAASTVLTVVPAHAATVPPPASALEVDWPGSPGDPAFGPGYGGYGPNAGLGPYGGYASPYDQVPVTAGLDATDATTAQSRGVVMVSTVVEFGSAARASKTNDEPVVFSTTATNGAESNW